MSNSVVIEKRFFSNIQKTRSCWLWVGCKGSNGYGRFMLSTGRPRMAHRLAYELANGPIPSGMYVLHRCDVRSCVNPKHLFIGTHKENMRDMVKKGRSKKLLGSKNGQAKLTEQDVIRIRQMPKDTLQYRATASELGVSIVTIYNVLSRKRWKHVA